MAIKWNKIVEKTDKLQFKELALIFGAVLITFGLEKALPDFLYWWAYLLVGVLCVLWAIVPPNLSFAFNSLKEKSSNIKTFFSAKRVLTWIIFAVFVILFSYLFVLFIQWEITDYHEAGHLNMCEAVNISCVLDGKSFFEYIQFINFNALTLNKYSASMQVIPSNLTEFCNLSLEYQQLIRIGGFRNDLKVILSIFGLLIGEIFFLFWFIINNTLRKKGTRHITLIIWIGIILLTAFILFNEFCQFQSYFSKNLGDLFYFPCSNIS